MKFKNEEIKIFKITFFIGIITHLFIIANPLFNPDGFYYYKGLGGGLVLGRWVIELLNILFDTLGYSIVNPMFNILLSIFILSFSSIFLLRILDLKNNYFKYIVSISLVISPSIVQIFFYSFTSHIYSIAIFLTILSIYFLVNKNNVFLYVICNFFSLGIYQAYIPFFLTLITIVFIKKMLKNEIKTQLVLWIESISGFLISLSMSLMMNYILNIYLNNNNYIYKIHGMSNDIIPYITFETLISSISKCYIYIYELCFLNNFFAHNTTLLIRIIYIILIFLCIILFIFSIYRYFVKKNIDVIISNKKNIKNILKKIDYILVLKFLIITIFVLFLPIAINFFVVMTNDNINYYDDRMGFSYVFFLIIPMCLLDFIDFSFNNIINNIKKWLSNSLIFISILFILHNVWIAYGSYYNQYNIINVSRAYAIELATRIQTCEGFNKNCKILFIGLPAVNSQIEELDTIYYSDAYFDIFSNQDFKYDNLLGDSYIFDLVFKKFSGLNIKKLEKGNLYDNIKYSKMVKDMNNYPDEGSIKIINDIIIVKFSETYE